jgi:hypothetical protein
VGLASAARALQLRKSSLTRYTHRVAITNSRPLNLDETHVNFRWKDYRKGRGHKSKVMRMTIAEFMAPFSPPRTAEWLPSH